MLDIKQSVNNFVHQAALLQQAVKSLLEYSQLTIDTTSKNFERFPLLLSDCFIGVVTVLLE